MEGLAKFPDRFERCVIAVIAVLLAAAVMTACSADTDSHVSERFDYDEGYSTSVIVDTETGVQYLCVRLYGESVSVTPLLDKWGFPLLAEGHERGARVEPSNDVDSKELVDDDQG